MRRAADCVVRRLPRHEVGSRRFVICRRVRRRANGEWVAPRRGRDIGGVAAPGDARRQAVAAARAQFLGGPPLPDGGGVQGAGRVGDGRRARGPGRDGGVPAVGGEEPPPARGEGGR